MDFYNQKHQYRRKIPLLLLMVSLLIVLFPPSSFAQDQYRNLILSDQHNEHYLSPYLARYTASNIEKAEDIVNNSTLQTEILPASGSIISLGLSPQTNWLTLDIINRSQQTEWLFDFGTSYEGRFGYFRNVRAFTYSSETQQLVEHSLTNNEALKIDIPLNQKTQVLLKLEKGNNLPITTPLRLLNSSKNGDKNFGTSFFLSIVFLIGMAFFFVAVSIIKFSYSYFFFSFYYIYLAFLLFVQNNYIAFSLPFAGDMLHAYMILGGATICLIIANFFWYPGTREFWSHKTFIIPMSISFLALLAGHFIDVDNGLFNFFLAIGPSIIIILLIPLICIMQGPEKNENITPFMLGWFILLFGICISVLALSGVLQPVSSAINAYWFILVPQAFFFAIAARIDVSPENERITLSKTLEINESDTVLKLRQTKENTEQDRLLKVIEQERRVLGELRKSEARRTEEMRKAKEIADEANKGKSAFLAVVSHEIRTPMTGIMGMVRMLLNSNLTKEQNEYAQTIQDSSDAMLALLNDILDFEKIEQGKMTFENISFDLHRLITGVATLMLGHAAQKNIELTTKIGDNLPHFVIGDPTRLRQVLLNLTGNALKFAEKGGVKITTELMKESKKDNNNIYEIYFSVTDNGIGISEEAKKDLFAPFSQADKTISRKFGGTGLGLAISKGLIEGMGSEINISSAEKEGSTFFFTLSMQAGKKDSPALTTKKRTTEENLKSQKILLVDDNHINRKVVHGLLSELPYKIEDVENAEDALKKLENEQFDIILMDIELTGMNGDEATKKIRAHTNKNIQKTPVIALTGNTQNEHIQKYYSCGINSFVPKPIDPIALIKTIEDASHGIFANNYQDNNAVTAKSKKEPVLQLLPEKLEEKGIHLELETDTPQPKEQKETPKIFVDKSPNSLPKIKPIIEKPIKSGPVFEKPPMTADHKVLPPIKQPNGSTHQELDIETLESLKKHLSKDKIKEMVDDVFIQTDEIINNLKKAMEKQNIETVKAKCHDLKGMAGNFGLIEISNTAKDIEQKVKTQPAIIILTLIGTLPDAKKRAAMALSKWLEDDTLDI